ncbi:MAG: hypothetical protein HGB10_05220 [Coriobacteriia bacterium]|nr:hypothetical protein [Coriobacteriia bacterium]
MKPAIRAARACAAASLVFCAFGAWMASACGGTASASPMPRGPGVAVASELAPATQLATPTVPVSVTVSRSFIVTGAVSSAEATGVTLTCYRRVGDAWVPEEPVSATVATADAGAYYSAPLALRTAGSWVVVASAAAVPEPSASPTSSVIRVSTRADAIVWNRDGVLTTPERMAYRLDARQMIVSTGATLKSKAGTTTVYEYRDGDWVALLSTPSRFGRNGLCSGIKRRRGNGTTPTGIWLMPDYVFGQYPKKLGGTRLKYRNITSRSWWSSERGAYYNTWVSRARRVDGEHLIDYKTAYEYALSTGYNAKPNASVYGRGAGIFLHVWSGPTTSGCVSVSRATMQRVFRMLDPEKRRVYAIGTLGTSVTNIERY